jgi:hypothetical protein
MLIDIDHKLPRYTVKMTLQAKSISYLLAASPSPYPFESEEG